MQDLERDPSLLSNINKSFGIKYSSRTQFKEDAEKRDKYRAEQQEQWQLENTLG